MRVEEKSGHNLESSTNRAEPPDPPSRSMWPRRLRAKSHHNFPRCPREVWPPVRRSIPCRKLKPCNDAVPRKPSRTKDRRSPPTPANSMPAFSLCTSRKTSSMLLAPAKRRVATSSACLHYSNNQNVGGVLTQSTQVSDRPGFFQ